MTTEEKKGSQRVSAKTRRPLTGNVLGIDLGSRSVGWALLEFNVGRPERLIAAGSRIFEAGVEGDFEKGRDQARAAARREARQRRRQTWRRRQRKRRLLRLLVAEGLLPAGDISSSSAVHEYLLRYDRGLRERYGHGCRVDEHTLFYRLRARALDEEIPLTDFGRLLYQLGQRRGFWSNRKAAKMDDDEGTVKKAIGELRQAMAETGARTLGEYLAGLDPEEERIRRRWTSRAMYKEEFAKLWDSQVQHHPVLTEELHDEIYDTIFFQRPLRSQKHLVGTCDLVPGRKRAPLACREAQWFRVLQAVNHLRVVEPGSAERDLIPEERQALTNELAGKEKLTWAGVRKVLGLGKKAKFNMERGGEKRILGHVTDAKLAPIFGERWEEWSEVERNQVVDQLHSMETDAAVRAKGERDWGLSSEEANELVGVSLAQGYAAHSRKALETLIPLMEEGVPYATAKHRAFPDAERPSEMLDCLPGVSSAMPELRNPAVARALTELRKVVNALARRWGKPEAVRIELARDLRNPRKFRREHSQRSRRLEKERTNARGELARHGIEQPSRADIEKYMLAEECCWRCPYTGRSIGFKALFGDAPQFDVEHIWPLSRSLDNTFVNKTLCHHEENREGKRNRTPWEAYGADEERFEQILNRVAKFQSNIGWVKMNRFKAEEIPEGFSERHLQDTRYASRLAMRYLSALYGGTVDASGRRRVRATSGGLTAVVRNELGMNGILGDGGFKTRDDHRHHAVDAVAIALTDDGMVQQLARAAEEAPHHRRRYYAPIEPPWEGFLDDVRETIDGIAVSHRPQRKISGALHNESVYGRVRQRPGTDGDDVEIRIRKPVHELSKGQLARIADPAVRAAVEAQVASLGGNFKKLENDPPVVQGADGRLVPVRSVRLNEKVEPTQVGKGVRARWVKPGNNHHMAIVAVLDGEGKEVKWEGHLVTMLEAHRRRAAREPVVQREWGEGRRFKFSLSSGDLVEISHEDRKDLFVVRTVTQNRKGYSSIEYVSATDARMKKEIKAAGDWIVHGVNSLRSRCRKVEVSPGGITYERND